MDPREAVKLKAHMRFLRWTTSFTCLKTLDIRCCTFCKNMDGFGDSWKLDTCKVCSCYKLGLNMALGDS